MLSGEGQELSNRQTLLMNRKYEITEQVCRGQGGPLGDIAAATEKVQGIRDL